MRIRFSSAIFLCVLLVVAFVAAAASLAGPPTASHSTTRLVTLRSEDEPIRQLLLRIGLQAGVSIIINGNVSGRVTVSLKHVSLDQALSAVLKPLGYDYEREGSILVVTNGGSRNRVAAASPVPSQAPAVLNVSIISGDRAAAILRKLYPHARLTVDRAANSVIATAPAEDVQAMRTVLQGLDIKNPTSTTVEAVQMHLAKPSDVAARLRPLYPGARIAAGPNKSILIAASPQDMAQIKAILASVDAPAASPAPTSAAAEAVRIVQAQPKDVARAIAHEFSAVRASVVGTSVILMGSPDDVNKAKTLIALIDQPGASMRYDLASLTAS